MTTPRHQPRPQARLGGLIVASIAAHWLVLAGWEPPAAPAITSAPLTVALLPAPVAAPQHSARMERSVESIESTVPPSPTPLTTTAALSAAATAIPEPAVATTNESAGVVWTEVSEAGITLAPPKTPALAEVQEKVRTTLNRDLNHHFKYPHLARLRSWEGTVLLDLQIETDGRISRITLAQSSGYTLLDNNAIATLHRIGNVSGAAQWLEGSDMELQLPVIYRLSDS
jgi:protein TonB